MQSNTVKGNERDKAAFFRMRIIRLHWARYGKTVQILVNFLQI